MMNFTTINPFNQKIIAEYEFHSLKTTANAIDVSERAFREWRKTSVNQRQQCFKKLAENIRKNASSHAAMATNEMGKLAGEAIGEVLKGASLADHYVENAEKYLRDEEVLADGKRHFIRLQPLGPLLSIMPWNFPYWQILRFAIPSIMAGNTTLVKPAYETVGCAKLLEKAFEESGFPKGVFQVIHPQLSDLSQCFGSEIIRGVSFTGSTNTGRLIYEKAASTLKKVVLELGGSDPFIVMPDADMELAIKGAVAGRLLNAGQTCIASKRFIVFASHYDQFVEQFHARMSTFKTGNPSLEETKLAPLFASRAVSPLNKQLSEAINCGARFVLQPQWQHDCAITPGIIENVNKSNPLYQQEVFAPIAVMYKVNSMAEAISVANDTPYGLAASVWGTDLKMMEQLANEIECGSVFFNSIVKSDARMPFGGVKNSGIGRELGRWGISEFSNIKGHSFY